MILISSNFSNLLPEDDSEGILDESQGIEIEVYDEVDVEAENSNSNSATSALSTDIPRYKERPSSRSHAKFGGKVIQIKSMHNCVTINLCLLR